MLIVYLNCTQSARPIVVRFHDCKERNKVWAIKSEIAKSNNITVVEDLLAEMVANRKKLLPMCFAAKKFIRKF